MENETMQFFMQYYIWNCQIFGHEGKSVWTMKVMHLHEIGSVSNLESK